MSAELTLGMCGGLDVGCRNILSYLYTVYLLVGPWQDIRRPRKGGRGLTKAALSRKRELFTWPTYGLADGMAGPIFKKRWIGQYAPAIQAVCQGFTLLGFSQQACWYWKGDSKWRQTLGSGGGMLILRCWLCLRPWYPDRKCWIASFGFQITTGSAPNKWIYVRYSEVAQVRVKWRCIGEKSTVIWLSWESEGNLVPSYYNQPAQYHFWTKCPGLFCLIPTILCSYIIYIT